MAVSFNKNMALA